MNSLDFICKLNNPAKLIGDLRVNQELISRLSKITVPFLCLNSNLAQSVNSCAHLFKISDDVVNLAYEIKNGEIEKIKRELLNVSITSAHLGLMILCPVIRVSLDTSISVYKECLELFSSIKEKDFHKIPVILLNISVEVFCFLTFFDCSIGYVSIHLSLKAISQFIDAASELKNETIQIPEFLAKTILAIIQSYQASQLIEQLYRTKYGENLTQELWNQIYSEITSRKETLEIIDLNKEFKKYNISSNVENINFIKHDLSKYKIEFFNFNNCSFDYCLIENSVLKNIKAYNSSFESTRFIKTTILASNFTKCNFFDAAFLYGNFYKSCFSDSRLSFTCWNDSNLESVKFEKSSLDYANFFNTKVRSSYLIKMKDLTECHLFQSKNDFLIDGIKPTEDLPIIALEWNFKDHGIMTPKIHKALTELGSFSLRFDSYYIQIQSKKLKEEVELALKNYSLSNQEISFANYLINNSSLDSEVEKLNLIASNVIKYADGLSLPGGKDVEPELYGKPTEPETNPYNTYKRSIFEFALINKAFEKRKPIMGTCRGSQIINVFFGGTLKQHITGHSGVWKNIHVNWQSSYLSWAIRNLGISFPAFSSHHQAIDVLAEPFEVLYECENIPKIYTSSDELILGCQIHPEIFVDMNQSTPISMFAYLINRKIYQIYLDRVKKFMIKN